MQRMTWALRISAFIVAALLYKTCMGQQRLLHGRVLDAEDGRPLANVHVQVMGSGQGTTTDEVGAFVMPWGDRAMLRLRFTHISYHALDISVRATNDTLTFHMERRINEIPTVTIRATTPEVVYQRDDLHVGDHRVNDEGLWVLTYARSQLWHRQEEAGAQVFRDARLYLLDTLFNEVASCTLPEFARRLHQDHHGRVIVEGVEYAWVPARSSGTILLERMARTTLHDAILPWTDSIPGELIGNDRQDHWPAFRHFAFDPSTERTRTIHQVEDKHVMSLFRSQYKYMSGRDKVMAMNMERELGVDREVIAGYMTGFHRDAYFKVPYAPLFVVRDTLCVFDHAAGRLHRFTTDLAPCGETSITHHMERGWRNGLSQDAATGTVYAMFHRNSRSILRAVDIHSGELGRSLTLTHPFPEEVRIHDGHAYYVYRPHGSTQRRTLYREALR